MYKESFLFIEAEHPVTHRVQSSNSILQIHPEWVQSLGNCTVVSLFERLKADSDQLKALLRQSGLVPVLERNFSQLGKQEQIQVLITFCQAQENADIYCYFLEECYSLAQVHYFLSSIKAIGKRLIYQSKINPAPELFELPNPIPADLNELRCSSPAITHSFKVRIVGADSLSLQIGEDLLQLEEEEIETFFSLSNRDLLIGISSDEFVLSKKEKKSHLKCDLLRQERAGARKWRYYFRFHSKMYSVIADRRSPTPFVYVRPSLLDCFFFHPESKERIYPTQIED